MLGAPQTTPRHGGGGASTICPRGRDGQRTTAATTSNSGSSARSRGETQVAPLSLFANPYVRAAGWRVGTFQPPRLAGASQGQAGCPQSVRTHAPDVTTTDGAPNARGHRDEPKQRGPAATATRTSCQLGPRPPLGSQGTAGEIQRTSLQTLSYTDEAHPGLAAPRFSQNHSVSRSYPAGLRRSPRGTLLLIPTPRRWTGRALTGHGDMHFLASPGGYSGLSVQQPGPRWMRTTADRLMTDLAVRRTVAAKRDGPDDLGKTCRHEL